MASLSLVLLCLTPAPPVEAPRPPGDPVELVVRITDHGRLVCAPRLRMVGGRTAEVRTGDVEVRVVPTVLPNGLVRFRIRAEQTGEVGAARPLPAAEDRPSSVGGLTLPSSYYLRDDVQYFPAGPEFLLPHQERVLEEYRLERRTIEQAPADRTVHPSAPQNRTDAEGGEASPLGHPRPLPRTRKQSCLNADLESGTTVEIDCGTSRIVLLRPGREPEEVPLRPSAPRR